MQFVFPMTPHSAIMFYVIVKQIMIARSPNALVVPVKQLNKYIYKYIYQFRAMGEGHY